MIGESLRYYPICKELKAILPPRGTVLDVGAKDRGIGLLYKGNYVGLDIDFTGLLHRRMSPVSGSILQMPFRTGGFDVVVCSDVIEHLFPKDRPKAVRELLRVARRGVIVGFPFGAGAEASDRFISRLYENRGKSKPSWLKDHLENGPVDEREVERVLKEVQGVRFFIRDNQNLKLGRALARLESSQPWKSISYLMGTLMPSLTGGMLCRFFDKKGPFARKIYTVILPRGLEEANLR